MNPGTAMKPRTAIRSLCLTLLAAAACAVPAISQETASPTYNIELVVFRATSALGGAENWAAEAGMANTIAGDEEAAGGSSQVGHFVAVIPSSAYQLNEIETRLRSPGRGGMLASNAMPAAPRSRG